MDRSGPRPSVLPVVLLIAALAVIAALSAWAGWARVATPEEPYLRVLVALMVLAYVGVNLRERAVGPHMGVSLSMVVLAAAIPLVGPQGAVMVGLVHLLDLRRWHWRPP